MNTSRIVVALLLIVGAAGSLATGTSAFFSDTETSTGNIFTAGDIDLKIDNTSYATDPTTGLLAASPATSWGPSDLNNGQTTLHKFFDFGDLKPDDEGEDTISIHAGSNDAWACMDVTLTSNDDTSSNEPELEAGDVQDLPLNTWDGELAQAIQMFWWADDGDNVYETGETTISGGIQTLYNLATSSGQFSVALADSLGSVWGGGPIPGGQTKYIAKAWCFGTLGLAAIPAGQGVSPLTATGVTCDGASIGNMAQTDSTTLDIAFRAVQSRNNPNFLCDECVITNQNVLFDGGFENPEVTNGAQWDIFASPAGGWNVEWRSDIPATFGPQNRPAIANLELHENVVGPAFEGDQYVELDTDWAGPNGSGDGEPASVTIYQDIVTVPGSTYQLSYRFSARPNTPASDNRVEMRWGGVVESDTGFVAGGGANSWQLVTETVVATSTMTRVQFTDLGTANSLGSFVDDFSLVKISCVPIQ